MIQQTHLTAWQSCAPWPKRSQIEQDLRLSRGVAAIFADSVLADHLAMRGGTVLHKAHLAPAARYSEVTVELDTLDDDGETVRANARSYDINEMLGTKTRALMQREQGRDLFDLFHAWQLSEAGATPYAVDGVKAMEAFAWYLEQEGTQLGAVEANAQLDARLRKQGFRRDMDTLLRPGLPILQSIWNPIRIGSPSQSHGFPVAKRNGVGSEKLQVTVDKTTERIVSEMVGLGIHGQNKSQVAAWILRTWIWDNQDRLRQNVIALVGEPSTPTP
jgi:hypothetical protein